MIVRARCFLYRAPAVLPVVWTTRRALRSKMRGTGMLAHARTALCPTRQRNMRQNMKKLLLQKEKQAIMPIESKRRAKCPR